MHIDQANIFNLKSLWNKYGSKALNINNDTSEIKESDKYVNTHWPHRCWSNSLVQRQDLSWLKNLPEASVFPVWPILTNDKNEVNPSTELSFIHQELKRNNWYCMLEQTAMFLALDNNNAEQKLQPDEPRNGFSIKKVRTPQDITLWLDIVTEAFGYSIQRLVIEKLLNDQNIQTLMAHHDGQAIASAILYKTDDVIGIHQVGVKQEFQGKGFARTFMKEIIKICQVWQGKHLVLQASQAGKPLYESLGFTSQFLIKSYKKT